MSSRHLIGFFILFSLSFYSLPGYSASAGNSCKSEGIFEKLKDAFSGKNAANSRQKYESFIRPEDTKDITARKFREALQDVSVGGDARYISFEDGIRRKQMIAQYMGRTEDGRIRVKVFDPDRGPEGEAFEKLLSPREAQSARVNGRARQHFNPPSKDEVIWRQRYVDKDIQEGDRYISFEFLGSGQRLAAKIDRVENGQVYVTLPSGEEVRALSKAEIETLRTSRTAAAEFRNVDVAKWTSQDRFNGVNTSVDTQRFREAWRVKHFSGEEQYFSFVDSKSGMRLAGRVVHNPKKDRIEIQVVEDGVSARSRLLSDDELYTARFSASSKKFFEDLEGKSRADGSAGGYGGSQSNRAGASGSSHQSSSSSQQARSSTYNSGGRPYTYVYSESDFRNIGGGQGVSANTAIDQFKRYEQAMKKFDPHSSDYYSRLGISKGTNKNDLKMAYRKASSAFHPDKYSEVPQEIRENLEESFKKIKEAYEYLSK
ncbi:MAG: DnaJ domain-containing protein [Pseudobdellovibrionaceae bacterium]|nr:DnaJ domain-containing protein [Bdellovibrionales bacterium]USN46621.1 MAG: DnaJ domain-containing protein [Pseudobdellovibrionaceae bacterium]